MVSSSSLVDCSSSFVVSSSSLVDCSSSFVVSSSSLVDCSSSLVVSSSSTVDCSSSYAVSRSRRDRASSSCRLRWVVTEENPTTAPSSTPRPRHQRLDGDVEVLPIRPALPLDGSHRDGVPLGHDRVEVGPQLERPVRELEVLQRAPDVARGEAEERARLLVQGDERAVGVERPPGPWARCRTPTPARRARRVRGTTVGSAVRRRSPCPRARAAPWATAHGGTPAA